jgi:hypothetical protein
MKTAITIVAAALSLSACSSIISGTSQEILVNTNPSQADCGLYRQGAKIGEVVSTPGSVLIQKTKHDVTVVCVRDGYQQTTYFNKSGVAGATFGNIILGGGIGWAIDSASGADNQYDSPVNLTMVPTQPVQAQATAPRPSLPSTVPEIVPVMATKPST